MDYQIASSIRIMTVKMIMSPFLLRMNFVLMKERRITVISNNIKRYIVQEMDLVCNSKRLPINEV